MAGNLRDHITQEIRAEMGRKRVSGAELARQLGVSEAYISRRLSGVGLDIADLERFAEVLGVPVSRFFPPAEQPVSGAA